MDTLIVILGMLGLWAATALGAALVYLIKGELSPKWNAILLGFAGGVMIAASIWSLILPSLTYAESWGKWQFVPALCGVLIGAVFMVIIDRIVPHFHKGTSQEEGVRTSLSRSTKLFLAMTIHNVPEGLAVGFAFGGAWGNGGLLAALGLAIGIALQNIPEGAAVSLSMKQELGSKHRSFAFGALSGIVEPIAAVLGFFLATWIGGAMPWLLSFAAGAMIFVVIEDLVPDAHIENSPHFGTFGVILGFVLMMVMDISLG